MSGVGDSFAWPFQDPGWFGKMILQGLIAVIPIIGWIAMAGWMMMNIDNFRAERRELAPAGFHLSRGAGIFFVFVIYGLILAIPGIILGVSSGGNRSSGLPALGNLISFVLRLILIFLTPAIILFVYRGGFSAGFDLGRIWATATSNVPNTLLAALVVFVANLIGGLGALLCLVGLLFTIPYSSAIQAGVVAWYERVTSGAPTEQPPHATA
jgi:hypothetical protein